MRLVLAVRKLEEVDDNISEIGPWDYTFEGSISIFQMQNSDKAEGTYLEASSAVPVPPKCPLYEWWYLCGVDVAEKSVVLFWDSMAHFRATRGSVRESSGVSTVEFSFHLAQVRANQKVRAVCCWAVSCHEFNGRNWSSFSQGSSSMLSHKALSVGNLKGDREREKKLENVIQREKSLDKYDEKPFI